MAAPKGNTYAFDAISRGVEFGRPSVYQPKYCKMLVDYFDIEPYREVQQPRSGGWEIKFIPNRFPTIERFAHSIGVHKDTIYQWAKTHKDFSDAMGRAKQLYESNLIENGLTGAFNPGFAIFLAKNTTNMTDDANLNVNAKLSLPDLATRLTATNITERIASGDQG